MAVKDVAKKGLEHGTAFTVSRWQAFREESPYFQAKVGIVLAWVLISVATLIVAPPSPAPFIVEQKAINFGLSTRTTLIIFNQAAGDLDSAVVEVTGVTIDFDGTQTPGTWSTKPIAIPVGLKTTLASEAFFDGRGGSPGYQLEVSRVRIVDDGDELYTGPANKPVNQKR